MDINNSIIIKYDDGTIIEITKLSTDTLNAIHNILSNTENSVVISRSEKVQ